MPVSLSKNRQIRGIKHLSFQLAIAHMEAMEESSLMSCCVLVKLERILAKEILADQWLEPMKMVKQFLSELLAGALDVLVKDILESMLEWLTILIGFKKQLQIISFIIFFKNENKNVYSNSFTLSGHSHLCV